MRLLNGGLAGLSVPQWSGHLSSCLGVLQVAVLQAWAPNSVATGSQTERFAPSRAHLQLSPCRSLKALTEAMPCRLPSSFALVLVRASHRARGIDSTS